MSESKRLILNADDFGWDDETVVATVALFEKGILSSATIMTGRPGTPRAIEYALSHQDKFSFGLHFNIVDGHTPCAKVRPSSLVDRAGLFRPSRLQRAAGLFGIINPDEVAVEFKAQLKILTDTGVRVSHVDSHGHLHKFGPVIRGIRKAMERTSPLPIRRPQNLFQTWGLHPRLTRKVFEKEFRGCSMTDHFFMLQHHEDLDWFPKAIRHIQPGVTEIGVHPGRQERWRLVETEALERAEVWNYLSKAGIQLITFNELSHL